MKAQAVPVLAAIGLLVLAGCVAEVGETSPPPALPPARAEQDRTAYNSQQVASFVSGDPAWQAWLNAIQASERADNALVDASRWNTPVIQIIEAITAAQDAYKVATSFSLPPFTVTSSCQDLPSETNGFVRLADGLTVRYGFILTETRRFDNGSSCNVSVGFVNEVDSSRGLTIAVTEPGVSINWDGDFARYLIWRQPFLRLSTGTTLSLSELVGLIER